MSIIAEINKKEEFVFPQNKIILLNGITLDCYPVAKEEEGEVVDDSLKLDTTGQYLSIGGKRLNPIPPTPHEVEEQRELFIDNAFYLLAHKERILSDSRMFLCPVHIQNGLAYTGTSGFRNPTLGIYIEWWLNCEGALQTDKKGHRSLVYHLSGSPLSGRNYCSVVDEKGKKEIVTLSPFKNYWPRFMKINQRYTEAKYKYQAYTLQEVLDILRHEESGNIDWALTLETEFMKREIMVLTERVEELKKERDYWYNKHNELLIKDNETKMRALYAEYQDLESKTNIEIEQLRAQKKDMKTALKSGQLDNKAYQQQLTPINNRIRELKSKLSQFKYEKVREEFPNGDISFNLIEQFIKKE